MVFMHFISQADDQRGNGSQEGWWQKQMQVPAVRNRMASPFCFTITAGAPFLFEILLFQPLSSFYEAILLPWGYSHSVTCGFMHKSVQSSYWTNPSKSEIIFAPADINHFSISFFPKKTVHVQFFLIKPHCVFARLLVINKMDFWLYVPLKQRLLSCHSIYITKYNQLTKCAEQICRAMVLENGIYTAGEFHLTDTAALNTYTMSFNNVLQDKI